MPIRILIVEDSIFERMMLKDIFQKAGYEVIGEASNSQEAIQKYNELNPDVVTMDIVLGKENGIKVTSKIVKKFPEAKVIIVSAVEQADQMIDALESGAKDYVIKPFENEIIVETIKKVIESKE